MKEDFYKIKESIATLSENSGYTIEVNIIEYNNNKEKLDIRKWNRNEDRMLKGISLNMDEAKELKDVLNYYFEEE